MAGDLSGVVSPAHDDRIRILETFAPDELRAAPPTPPHLTYRGGPLLGAAEVFTVFWGAAWNNAPLSPTAGQINSFLDVVLTSSLMEAQPRAA